MLNCSPFSRCRSAANCDRDSSTWRSDHTSCHGVHSSATSLLRSLCGTAVVHRLHAWHVESGRGHQLLRLPAGRVRVAVGSAELPTVWRWHLFSCARGNRLHSVRIFLALTFADTCLRFCRCSPGQFNHDLLDPTSGYTSCNNCSVGTAMPSFGAKACLSVLTSPAPFAADFASLQIAPLAHSIR